MQPIVSERLRLRLFTDADAPFVLALLNDPGWLKFIGSRNVHNLADATNYIQQRLVANYSIFGFTLYLIERKSDNLPIGMCGLLKRDFLAEVDLGYALLLEHCGRGYAIEASRAVIADARSRLGIEKIAAFTETNNLLSIRLLQKLGFICLGRINAYTNTKAVELFLLPSR